MNTEASQDTTVAMTIGQRLREARENLGWSQQSVAERLCLRLSTIRELEDDNTPSDLSSTFLRGYIRSYAKLINLSEDELAPLLSKHVPQKITRVASMQTFSVGKKRKRRDVWLMIFTWIVVLVVLGLTCAWWWQNHQVQQEEISVMAHQSSEQLSQRGVIPVTREDNAQSSRSSDVILGKPVVIGGIPVDNAQNDHIQSNTVQSNDAQNNVQNSTSTPDGNRIQVSSLPADTPAVSPSQTTLPADSSAMANTLPTAVASVGASDDSNGLVMTFSADCWIQVSDASGKILSSGIQQKGTTLNLNGQSPYKLILGVPAAVQVTYQGNMVDLSPFTKSNRVARLTVPPAS